MRLERWEAKVGQGDQLLGTGLARGAAARGKQIAFGDGRKLRWDSLSANIFQGNPNICQPGDERAANVEWIPFYQGNRLYNKIGNGRWIWNYDFKPIPGELFFSTDELAHGSRMHNGFVVIEPNVPMQKSVAPNKQWPVERYEEVARRLKAAGHAVVQFSYGGQYKLPSALPVQSLTFRKALAVLQKASLYIGPEGGLHHGAAAVGVKAVVLFGGFVPPSVTGYDTHINLTGGAVDACGSLTRCAHCAEAMNAISVDDVLTAADGLLAAA
jgi:ADP-heptose:LPS heptosyltransferase